MSSTVHVENISHHTSEKEVREFFSFCGKISSLSVTPTTNAPDASQSATVTFEKESAAKTALLLDNTQLGPAQVHVTAAKSLDELAAESGHADTTDDHEIAQEDKPRTRILAEYLAQGYTIGDKAIERAITLDHQHGVSSRFMGALKNFDTKFKAVERAHTMDTKYGVSEKAATGWRGLSSYFEKAIGTPTGQKLRAFYEKGNKQVMDVHNEARHLANLKKEQGGKAGSPESVPGTDRTKCNCHASAGKCTCVPGTCACASCAKNPEVESKVGVEEAGMEQIPGTDRTKCNCGATAEACPCSPGKCACANCAKNPETGGPAPSSAAHSTPSTAA